MIKILSEKHCVVVQFFLVFFFSFTDKSVPSNQWQIRFDEILQKILNRIVGRWDNPFEVLKGVPTKPTVHKFWLLLTTSIPPSVQQL